MIKHAYLSLIFILLFCFEGHSQIFLQIEINNQVETIKYAVGEKITFKSDLISDEWVTKRIKEIMPEENVLLFSDTFVNINDISKVRRTNNGAKAASISFLTFGSVYALYGLIIHFTSDFKFDWTNAAIAGASVGTGYIFKKFENRTYNVKKTSRLRIVDLRFNPTREN